jgi:hypothetical protein
MLVERTIALFYALSLALLVTNLRPTYIYYAWQTADAKVLSVKALCLARKKTTVWFHKQTELKEYECQNTDLVRSLRFEGFDTNFNRQMITKYQFKDFGGEDWVLEIAGAEKYPPKNSMETYSILYDPRNPAEAYEAVEFSSNLRSLWSLLILFYAIATLLHIYYANTKEISA